ncbi:DUF1761 domain-containing protein [Maritalea porphyrae]|uniref:DUF1761 domain-containing protein n=1 Tax=Maritalea porphyrae TaxID=880732 RepID=UPI0022AFE054|nr:DUF1761 domain-containing protein [Maritalea porphyrae]MCZ4274093.1 DUF1761 domain-containing protein [Maritalea porphyrae]
MIDVFEVSWIAIIVGTIGSYLLGVVWYSPVLFVKKWAEGIGAKADKPAMPPLSAMLAQFVGLFLLAWIIELFSPSQNWAAVVLISAMFVVLQYGNNTFTGKSTYAKLTEGGYILACVTIIVLVQLLL